MNVFLRSAGILLAASTVFAACESNEEQRLDAGSAAPMTGFTSSNLISDQVGVASHLDPSLVNAWGVATDTQSIWIANNASGHILVVAPDGSPSRAAPPSSALDVGQGIDGIVFNSANTFKIGPSSNRGPAKMLVSSETGQIFAINPAVASTPQLVVDRTGVGAVYKGLAIFTMSDGTMRLAAVDFHNARIDVFDTSFQLVTSVVLVDPNLRAGLAPFNIVAIGSNLYVTYAVQDAMKHDDVPGVGNGRIDVFDLDGRFVQVLLDGGQLNAPWGVALAPADFGSPVAGNLVVGNFGDGTLLAIDPATGNSAQMLRPDGSVLVVDGLWGLMFGNGQGVGATSSLFFAAGPNQEMHGLFGRIFQTTVTPP
jgi:uncharacterized protein (TIGR03118 family)